MADLIVELTSEEMPARMQQEGAERLAALLLKQLREEEIEVQKIESFSTPRRLILYGKNFPLRREAKHETKRGPRIDAPPQAIEGFLKANHIASIDCCNQQKTAKGTFWFVDIHHPPVSLADILPQHLSAAIKKMSWPNAMRFGAQSFRWIRPLHHISILFDQKPLEGILETGAEPILFRSTSTGHARFSPEAFPITGDFTQFSKTLYDRYVDISPDSRKKRISQSLTSIAEKHHAKLVDDPDLLKETAGLCEWPKVLCGKIDPIFMTLPKRVITEVLRTHQKCFVFSDTSENLLPLFAVIAEIPENQPADPIINGYERIIRARLSDAAFFIEKDGSISLSAHAEKLQKIIFHKKLGTMQQRTQRLVDLACFLCPLIVDQQGKGINSDEAKQAALLCKADLTTLTVGEFPKLQGYIAAYYARLQGKPEHIAAAIEQHYTPPGTPLPKAPLSILIALTDKIDHLCSLWLAGEIPTGSKDPFALRRAALGILRLILENNLRINLKPIFEYAVKLCPDDIHNDIRKDIADTLLNFFADRLKIYLRDLNIRQDVIQSIFMLSRDDDLSRLVSRISAMQKMIDSEDGHNLLTAWRRCTHILIAEEKRDQTKITPTPDSTLFTDQAENGLFDSLNQAKPKIESAIEAEKFTKAMSHMATLRQPVDVFFDAVLINDKNIKLRENRLRLVAFFRETMQKIAYFDSLEGTA